MASTGRFEGRVLASAFLILLISTACSDDERARSDASPSVTQEEFAAIDEPGEAPTAAEAAESEAYVAAVAKMLEPFHGDLDEMVERRYIRVLVALSRTQYFLDKGQEFGAAYEGGKQFEAWLNERLGSGNIKVQLVFVPTSRERLFEALREGRGDMAAANLTVTDERKAFADFATPFASDVSEIVVIARDQPPLRTREALSGREIHVRKSSSYHASLLALDAELRAAGKPPLEIVPAPEHLEDEDLLEMVDAGLVPATVVDSHIADMWKQVFEQMVVVPEIRLREGASIAWAVRKGCPDLLATTSAFVEENRKGTLIFNVIYKKYLKSTKWVGRAGDDAEMKKFRAATELFQKYGEKYDIPWLLLAALAYQESRIDQDTKSSAGAVGVMQIKPSTAEGKPIEIQGVERSMDRNIEAGTKYLRFIADRHVNEPTLDPLTRGLFVAASYNAGPTRIAKLRKKAAQMGLDPDQWFGNVEVVAAKEIGRETVQYVANVYKYYVTYDLAARHAKAGDR
jgi:membrane-bound lytic murein transglycosylase MltF